jgi:primosomal protein N' (replication factor Y) (superfamily II helicase)
MGAGTERLERDLAERFGAPVLRLDADATRTRGSVGEILAEFGGIKGPAVLAGTQMVAKGHDFPDVELAVVVDADQALAIPDFRAEERAFSLVAQLAGRAGRATATAAKARVLVQTWDPEQEFLQLAATHDVERFLGGELERRRELGYPPFSRLVRVLVSTRDGGPLVAWAEAVADGLRRLDIGPVLGPANLLRLSGRERAQCIVKTTRPSGVADAMRSFLRRTASERSRADVRIVLDVDPQNLV